MTKAAISILKRMAKGATILGARAFPHDFTYRLLKPMTPEEIERDPFTPPPVPVSTLAHLVEGDLVAPDNKAEWDTDEITYTINERGRAFLDRLKQPPGAVEQLPAFDLEAYTTPKQRRMD